MTDPHSPTATDPIAVPTGAAQPFAGQTIAEVLERWPQTMAVFLQRRMACPGCAMAPFMTLAEAAECYGVPMNDLLDEIRRAVAGDAPSGPFAAPLPHRRTAPAL